MRIPIPVLIALFASLGTAAACGSAMTGITGISGEDAGATSGSGSGSGSSSGGGSGGSSGGGSGSSSGSGSGGSSGGGSGSSSGGGSGSSSGGTTDAGPSAGGDGGAGAACSCAGGPTNCAVWTNVYMTYYGFNDNSCNAENQHSCNTIAYPGLGPKKHPYAMEGAGTYGDPITCAASGDNSGMKENESMGGATLSAGTIVYNPQTQKYYVMEDQCAECTADYNCKYDDDEPKGFPNDPPAGCKTNTNFHIDFWMGPSFLQDQTNLINCEDNSSIGDVYLPSQGPLDSAGSNGTVIINPPSNLPVRSGMLFEGTDAGNGGCWTDAQVVPAEEWCH